MDLRIPRCNCRRAGPTDNIAAPGFDGRTSFSTRRQNVGLLVPYTRGFKRAYQRDEHFDKHPEVGASDEEEYEMMADEFLGGPMNDTTVERVRRKDGATLRWDRATNRFGIVNRDGYIQTFYILDPAYHRFSSNRAYFEWECTKR